MRFFFIRVKHLLRLVDPAYRKQWRETKMLISLYGDGLRPQKCIGQLSEKKSCPITLWDVEGEIISNENRPIFMQTLQLSFIPIPPDKKITWN